MTIKHKRNATSGYIWQNTDLVEGQIGVNTTDGTLHVLKQDNTIENINKAFGTVANTITEGNDPRLSDSRSPLSHTHLESDLTIDKYTKSEIDTALALKQNILDKQLDQVSNILVYKAYAITGSLLTSPVWSIAKYTKTGDTWTTTYPTGDSSYSYIWNNRLSYTYI